ncbi:MAG: MmgE/PrpD family protein [Chloroflexi bacterium]|nr:MmgE/PrpD family protein [Chloroflexota bacterium]
MTAISATLVDNLATWATSTGPEGAPVSARRAARRLVLDRLGISLGGRRLLGQHPTAMLALPGQPSASLWGERRSVFAPYAALANGCAGDALELEAGPDCVEAGWAAAEIADRSFGDLLTAVIAGAEVGGYVRRWLAGPLEEHGLHPPAMLGALSATVTAGRLLGLSAARLAGALAGVACLTPRAPFGPFTGGSTGKTLYGGWPHFLGLWAGLWSADGMVGPPTALEGSRGIAQSVLDAGGAVTPPPFGPGVHGWDVEQVTFKPFPCCRASHPALTALAGLERADPAAIREVRVRTYPYAVELERRVRGQAPIAAQASVRWSVAVFLAHGELQPGRSFTATTVSDPIVTRLADCTTVEVGLDYAGEGPRVRGAQVEIVLNDGRVQAARADEPRWGPSAPATDEELRERFCALVGDELPPALVDADLLDLPESTPMRALVAASERGGTGPSL